MKFLNFDNVLCLSPHPDDIEYGALGSIILNQDTKFHAITLSEGTFADKTSSPRRLHEFVNTVFDARNKDISNYTGGTFPPSSLRELHEDGWIYNIEKHAKETNVPFDCVLVPPLVHDAHYEHRFVSGFAQALSRLKPVSILEYRTVSATNDWCPNYFIDISSAFNTKVELLQNFKSQLHRPYFSLEAIRDFHTNFNCTKRGLRLVEQFKIVTLYENSNNHKS